MRIWSIRAGAPMVRSLSICVIDEVLTETDGYAAYLPRLPDSTHFYLGPPRQEECRCNTVAYSMVQACQQCQFNASNPETILPYVPTLDEHQREQYN